MAYCISLRKWIVLMGSVVLLAATSLNAQQATGPELKVGALFDLTGFSSDIGKSYAQGVRDAAEWTNGHDGINGKRIKLVEVDYGYKIPEAVAAYKRMVTEDKVLMISGWGTGDTEALREQAAKDKVPYVSGSFTARVSDPSQSPYNFFVAPTYSDELRAWLKWVKEDWEDKSRNPKVAALFADNPYGRSPMNAGKEFAKEIGIDWVYEGVLPGTFEDAISQLLSMQKAGADKQEVREFLFENTGVPVRAYEDAADAEGSQRVSSYQEILIDGERCYRKFHSPASIRLVVAGGTAGKFSAVLGSWAAGPRGSEMVTYPI